MLLKRKKNFLSNIFLEKKYIHRIVLCSLLLLCSTFVFQQMVKNIYFASYVELKLLSRQYFFDCQMGIGNRKIFFEGIITYYLVSIVIKMLLTFLLVYVWVIFHLYVGSQSSLYCAITCQIKNWGEKFFQNERIMQNLRWCCFF